MVKIVRSLPVSPIAARARSLASFRSLGFPFTAPTTPGGIEPVRAPLGRLASVR